jgi:hypothetical protein
MTLCSPRALLLIGLVLAGCSPVRPPAAKSLLAPAAMSTESAVLEVFFIRCPMGDQNANTTLWEQVDEQAVSSETRLQLARNGFRVGLVGAQVPLGISRLLDLAVAPASGPENRIQASQMQDEPQVIRRHMQVRPGTRQEIIASEVYDELPVLVSDGAQLAGQTYAQAQGMFALRTNNLRDGQVKIDLVPEIHHGLPRQRWVAGQGMYRLDAGRDKKAFDSMSISAPLARGQMLVMTCLPNRPGSLGYHFFSDKRAGRTDQKLLVMRLAQAQHDDLVMSAEELDLQPRKTADSTIPDAPGASLPSSAIPDAAPAETPARKTRLFPLRKLAPAKQESPSK